MLAVVGPFCTGRGGATREIEGWGGVDPVAMGTNMLLCKTGDCVWTIGGRNRKRVREGERERGVKLNQQAFVMIHLDNRQSKWKQKGSSE